MSTAARAIVVALLALLGAVLLSLSITMTTTAVTITTAVHLLATYAIKGTQVPIFDITSDQAISQEAIQYVGGIPPATAPNPVASPIVVVNYPATLPPISVGGFSGPTWDQSVATGVTQLQHEIAAQNDTAPVIFGYSQGAIVASQYKKAFNANPTPGTNPTFVLIGNGDRPNGGSLARLPGLFLPIAGLTFTSATPTTTAGAPNGTITTTDIAGQYDPIADAPTNPLNPFSEANSALGLFYVHLNYANLNTSSAVLQDQYGDTAYYLIPTYPVPLLMPLEMVPVVGPIAADTLDPVVRVLVESGYNRTISPGQPTTYNIFYFPNPIAFGGNLLTAIPTGLDNGLQDIGVGRALGTMRPDIGPGSTGQGAYGIGGPPVTLPGNTLASQQTTLNSASSFNPTSAPQDDTPAPQTTSPADDTPVTPPANTRPGPKFNPIFSLSPTTGTTLLPSTLPATNPSGPNLNNPIGNLSNPIGVGLNSVANSIKSALGGLSKVGAGAGTGS
jgi:PE-PPE domain